MQELIKRGHRVYAICPKGDKNDALKSLGCEIVNYEIERRSLNPITEILSIKRIYDAVKNINLDILQTFTAKPNIYGTLAGKKAKIPFVINLVEGLGSFYVTNNPKHVFVRGIMENLYKIIFRMSDGCIFVNTSDPEYMLKKGIIKAEKVKIIKSVGVDTKKFSMQNYTDDNLLKIRRELKVEGKTVVLMVARAIWDKGIREYYEAARVIRSRVGDVEFLLVGGLDDGNPSCASEEFLRSGAVKWLGHRDDIVDITAISDVCVLPSYREGFPVTLMEACSMGKPIVTTDTYGCREVVSDGMNGFLVPARDYASLAEKIEVLIRDGHLRKDMGRRSREKALNEFDVTRVIAQYISYYERFI